MLRSIKMCNKNGLIPMKTKNKLNSTFGDVHHCFVKKWALNSNTDIHPFVKLDVQITQRMLLLVKTLKKSTVPC